MNQRLFLIPIILVLSIVVFWVGVLVAYELDVLESKAPNPWSDLQVTQSYDQTDQYTPVQPAYDITKLDKELWGG